MFKKEGMHNTNSSYWASEDSATKEEQKARKEYNEETEKIGGDNDELLRKFEEKNEKKTGDFFDKKLGTYTYNQQPEYFLDMDELSSEENMREEVDEINKMDLRITSNLLRKRFGSHGKIRLSEEEFKNLDEDEQVLIKRLNERNK